MRKSELEKAANDWIAKIEAEFGLDIAPTITRRAFVAGAKYALAYAYTHVKFGSACPDATREFLAQFFEIEEDEKEK